MKEGEKKIQKVNEKSSNDFLFSQNNFVYNLVRQPNDISYRKLNEATRRGYLVIVITNQRGIGKEIMSKNDFEKVMAKLNEELEKHGAHIDAYHYYPDVDDASPCRKPNIGMFLKAKEDFLDIYFKNSFVVGASWRDVEAGKKLGAKTILIGNNTSIQIKSDYVVNNLLEVVSMIEECYNESKND